MHYSVIYNQEALIGPLILGTPVVLSHPFDPESYWAAVDKYHISVSFIYKLQTHHVLILVQVYFHGPYARKYDEFATRPIAP